MSRMKSLTQLLLLIFMTFLSKGYATIIETAHIQDVVPLIDRETWFLVDLDNTFFEAAQALGHIDWFYDEIQMRVDQGMTRNEAIRDIYPDWIKTQQVCRVQPLEEEFVPILTNLQNQGVTVIGYTHRQPSVADATLKQLSSLGFDFAKTAPTDETFNIPAQHPPTLYTRGVFFVSDYNSKGDVLIPFLERVGQTPKKIVFIDDKRQNVEDLEEVLASTNIEYTGVHYTACHYTTPLYSREIAKFQYKFLDQIMSNEAALTLLDQGCLD